METNFFPSKNNGKENKKNEKNTKKVNIISYKHLTKDDFCEPFYFNKEEFQKHKKFIKKKNRLFNFVESEDKNKNLKIFDGEKFNSYINIINNNSNINRNNYYLNRKFSTIIFNRIHKLNLTCIKNYNESVVNKLYYCTKINLVNNHKKNKFKKIKSDARKKYKSLEKDSLINRNAFEKLYLQRLKLKQSNSISNIKQEYKKDKEESNKDQSQSKDKVINHSQNNTKTFKPNFSVIYNKNTLSQIKKEDSSSVSNNFSLKPKHNNIFNKIVKGKNKYSPINKRVGKSGSSKQEKKTILINPFKNRKLRNKVADVFIPKLKVIDSNSNIKYNKQKYKSFQALQSQELSYQKNFTFYNSKENNHKNKIIKNINSSKNRNQKINPKNFPSFKIMNLNHKKVQKNFIKYIHYLNETISSICNPTFSNSNINKQNTIQITKASSIPKINSDNSFINLNKSIKELRKNNSVKKLENKKEYKRVIRNKIFNSLQKENEPIIFEKAIKPNYNEIMLRKYESQFFVIKEYFK